MRKDGRALSTRCVVTDEYPIRSIAPRGANSFEFRNSAGSEIKVFRVKCDRKTSDMKIRFEVPNKLEITFGRGTECYVILCFINNCT